MQPDFTIFLVLAGSVYKFVEFIKPIIAKRGFTDDIYNAVVQLIACIIGVVLAFVAGNVNLFPAVLPIPQIVAVTLTGILIGLGGDVVNAVLDLLYSWQRPTAPVVTTTTPAPIGSSTTVDVTTSSPAFPNPNLSSGD